MHRAFLPKALALTVLTAGLTLAGAQQAQPTPDNTAPQQETGMPHHRHAPDPQKEAEHLSRKLNLTSDQTSKLEPILATRDQQMDALRQNSQLSPEDRHQQMRTINQTAQQGMASVLTPDQLAQLKAMRRDHRHHGGADQPADQSQSPS